MIKALILDFDGVIVDTELIRFKYFQKELAKHKFALKNEDLPIFIGKKSFNAIKEIFPHMDIDLLEKIIIKRRAVAKKEILELKPLANIEIFLQFASSHYKLGLATGSSFEIVNAFLKKYDLLKYFDEIVYGEDFKSSKPDPECFNLLIHKLEVKNSDVIIIEDSRAGIDAAKKINSKVFGIDNKYNSKDILNANRTFKKYNELINILRLMQFPIVFKR